MLNLKGPYVVRVCPECGEQEAHYSAVAKATATYCLNHENEPRETRPAHVTVEVIPVAEADRLREALKCVTALLLRGGSNIGTSR